MGENDKRTLAFRDLLSAQVQLQSLIATKLWNLEIFAFVVRGIEAALARVDDLAFYPQISV